MHSLHHVAALDLQHVSKGDVHIRDHEARLLPTINLYTTNPNIFRLSHLQQFLGQAREERNIGVETCYHLFVLCCSYQRLVQLSPMRIVQDYQRRRCYILHPYDCILFLSCVFRFATPLNVSRGKPPMAAGESLECFKAAASLTCPSWLRAAHREPARRPSQRATRMVSLPTSSCPTPSS